MAKARAAKRKKKILFVCTGNTCRSPMAENLFRYILGKKRKLSLYDVSSAGLAAEAGAPMTENALLALAARGAAPRRKHAAQQLTVQAAAQADGIVCMTASHKAALAAFTAACVGKEWARSRAGRTCPIRSAAILPCITKRPNICCMRAKIFTRGRKLFEKALQKKRGCAILISYINIIQTE